MERDIFFGTEPSDEEVLIFVNGSMLAYFQHFAKCGVEVKEKQRPKNIKRIIRQAAKEVNVNRFTKAQEAISLSYELHKQEKKVQSKEKREAEKQRRRLIKVQKQSKNIVVIEKGVRARALTPFLLKYK